MTDNLVTIRAMQECLKYKNSGVALLGYDFEKAFDRVDHEWIMKVLTEMGFGPMFRKWIKVLYNNIQSKIDINGLLTDPINIQRGVRQGCPISMLLFVISLEPMLNVVRKNERNKRIY